MKAIVVYYSRTKTTQKVADFIAEQAGCIVEELVTSKYDSGIFGFLSAGFDAVMKIKSKISPISHSPSEYDVVIIGTPIWAGTCSDPVRSYLTENASRFQNVAFFSTSTWSGSTVAFSEMSRICGKNPIATLDLNENDVKYARHGPAIETFVQSLKVALGD